MYQVEEKRLFEKVLIWPLRKYWSGRGFESSRVEWSDQVGVTMTLPSREYVHTTDRRTLHGVALDDSPSYGIIP